MTVHSGDVTQHREVSILLMAESSATSTTPAPVGPDDEQVDKRTDGDPGISLSREDLRSFFPDAWVWEHLYRTQRGRWVDTK